MVKHIVFFRLNKEFDAAARRTHAKEIKQRLEALSDSIPELLAIEVGINFNVTDNAADISLYTEFATRGDLDNYLQHPEHVAVVPFVNSLTEERRVVDYDL